jgi:predicted dehydrogenase
MIGVGIVGCGYWGPNLARNFGALEACELRALCDVDAERVARVARHHPSARVHHDFGELLRDPGVDAVAICTPVHTHFPLASEALQAGKHVLVEKPLTHSVETAELLVELARRQGRVLQVDHTFVYSPAVQKLRRYVESGELGDLLYIDSVRINLGLFQPDVNVLWDLATHDLSIIGYLVERPPLWVSAIGAVHFGTLESQAYVTLMLEGSLLVHLHVNWLAPVKLRSTVIGGTRRMIVYDDLEPSEKIRVYPGSRARALVDYRLGDVLVPHIEKGEPLEAVCRGFVGAIQGSAPPLTDGWAGLGVVRILEAAQQSMRKGGERIVLGSAR